MDLVGRVFEVGGKPCSFYFALLALHYFDAHFKLGRDVSSYRFSRELVFCVMNNQ